MHVITGASAGIGRGVADALIKRGQTVIAVARRAEALATIEGAQAVVADVSTTAGRAAIVAAVDGEPVSSIVHCAATDVPPQSWVDIDADALTTQLQVHVVAPIALTAALLNAGAVERAVIIDSYSATTPRIGWAAYGILKAAAQMSFRAAAEELPDTAVARVFPGAVATSLLQTILDGDPALPAVELYRGIRDDGKVSAPADIGREIAAIILDTDLTTFRATAEWHVGHSI